MVYGTPWSRNGSSAGPSARPNAARRARRCGPEQFRCLQGRAEQVIQAGEGELGLGFHADGTEHLITVRASVAFQGGEQGRLANARVPDDYQGLSLGPPLGVSDSRKVGPP
jgi:hypothetical protein